MLRADLAPLKAERAAAMAEAPGDSTGLLIRQYQGAQALPVYKVDTGLLSLFSELRAHEKQAAEELGQWRRRASHRRGWASAITRRMNAGRHRRTAVKRAVQEKKPGVMHRLYQTRIRRRPRVRHRNRAGRGWRQRNHATAGRGARDRCSMAKREADEKAVRDAAA